MRGVIGSVVHNRVTRHSCREVSMPLEPRCRLQDTKKPGFKDRNSRLRFIAGRAEGTCNINLISVES